jgi:hypothetical protein
MSDDKRPSGDTWTHQPLPYRVRMRVTAGDDATPTVVEHRCLAYSVLEAVIQASMSATGAATIDNQKVTLERIEPDVAMPEQHDDAWRLLRDGLALHDAGVSEFGAYWSAVRRAMPAAYWVPCWVVKEPDGQA